MKYPPFPKKTFILIAVVSGLCLLFVDTGCKSATQAAANIETVTVPTVDAALGTWAKWCYATNATAAQINDVSNAYTSYVNYQNIASNVLMQAASNPNSTLGVSNIVSAASASQGALLNLITLYTTK